jgi:phage terminase large subunit-like protein
MHLKPKQDKNAVVAIGRFSSPTKGHYFLFDKMRKFIRTDKAKELKISIIPIVVIIDGEETGKDKQKNPLSPHERIKFMQASGKADGLKFLIAKNAVDAFNEVRKQGYEPLVIAAGSDRKTNYLKILDETFTDNGKKMTHYAIRGLDRTDDESTDISATSGTKMREAVINNDYERYLDLSGLEHKPELAKQMFDKLKKVLHGDS